LLHTGDLCKIFVEKSYSRQWCRRISKRNAEEEGKDEKGEKMEEERKKWSGGEVVKVHKSVRVKVDSAIAQKGRITIR
jgi:hypothetical protein